jgi:outer membrane protein OmpA-like peptidoglycan-associated protein
MIQKHVFLWLIGFLVLLMATTAAHGPKDHPVIKPIPGFVLDDSKSENFSSYTFRIEEKDQWIEKSVKGKYWFIYYEYQKEDKEYSKLEIIENYKQAAQEKGGKILSENDTKLDFTVPKSDGGTIWAHLHTWPNSYELYIIEEKGFAKKLFFGADEMKKQLDSAGRVAIYGIYFDFDKSNLKSGSEKMLIEIVKLMKNHPSLRIEIQGHTDSTGTKEYNLKLSDRRARTVKSFLILYGIDPARMTTGGYGLSQPLASNETEEGRALNRRVELKKI